MGPSQGGTVPFALAFCNQSCLVDPAAKFSKNFGLSGSYGAALKRGPCFPSHPRIEHRVQPQGLVAERAFSLQISNVSGKEFTGLKTGETSPWDLGKNWPTLGCK